MAISSLSTKIVELNPATSTKVLPNLSGIFNWQLATWSDYLNLRDDDNSGISRLFFNTNQIFIEMGQEGITHAKVSDLFIFLLVFWFSRYPDIPAETFGRCLLEKAPQRAAAPDLVLYVGGQIPTWQEGEPRRINLNQWRVPDLVGEISDTTLATDLDEKKQLYAALGIAEYWVIDSRGSQVLIFKLQSDGTYEESPQSLVLKGLTVTILSQALQKLHQTTNVNAASWLIQQISILNVD